MLFTFLILSLSFISLQLTKIISAAKVLTLGEIIIWPVKKDKMHIRKILIFFI